RLCPTIGRRTSCCRRAELRGASHGASRRDDPQRASPFADSPPELRVMDLLDVHATARETRSMGSPQGAIPSRNLEGGGPECVKGEIAFAGRSSDEEAPAVVVPNYENHPMVLHDVIIRNARPIAHELSLDREGFTLVKHKTSCANERRAEVMREKYLDEM